MVTLRIPDDPFLCTQPMGFGAKRDAKETALASLGPEHQIRPADVMAVGCLGP